MAHIRFLWDNLIDDPLAALVASSENAEFPVENIQHELFLKHWRSESGNPDTEICVDLSSLPVSGRDVRAWVIKNHNLDAADCEVQASNTDDLCGSGSGFGSGAWSGSGYGSGHGHPEWDSDCPEDDPVAGFFATPQNFNYWKFVLYGAGVDTYDKIGRIFLGDYFEPSYDTTIPPEVTEADDSEILPSRQGQEYVNIVTQYEIVTYVWKALPASDIATMKEIFQSVGRHKSFFIHESDVGTSCLSPACSITRYVKNIESWIFEPVIHGWGSVIVRVKTER